MSNTPNWKKLSTNLKLDGRAFINGKRVAATSGTHFDCISPINGKKIAEIARCDIADIDLAVASARAAFEDGCWAHKTPRERKMIMVRLVSFCYKTRRRSP